MRKSEILLRAHAPEGDVTARFTFNYDQSVQRVDFDEPSDASLGPLLAWLAPWLAGQSLPRAYENVVEAVLAAFPQAPLWWGELGLEVIRQALYLTNPKVATDEEDRVVCKCHKVMLSTLKKHLAQGPGVEWSALTALTKAGSGCGSCVPELMQLAAQAAPPSRRWQGQPNAYWIELTQAALDTWRERARFPWVKEKGLTVTAFSEGVLTVRVAEGLTSDQEWDLTQALTDYFGEGFPAGLSVLLDFALL